MPPTTITTVSYDTTPAFPNFLTVSSSEAASLKGQKAKTPIIAGSICGGLMGIAWIVGFTVYFVKRYKRKKRKRAVEAGKKQPKPPKAKEPEEPVIIPPDPAVLFGQKQPGEHVLPPPKRHHRAKSKDHARIPEDTQAQVPMLPLAAESNTSIERAQTPQDSPATRLLPAREMRDISEGGHG